MKKATVLKSYRTDAGARDWIKVFAKKYEGQQLKIVDTDTLKGYDDYAFYDEPIELASSHVVIEEDLSPTISVIKESEFGELVKEFISKGFMELGSYGPCFTDKWHKALDHYVSDKLKDAFKSVKLGYEFSEESVGDYQELYNILKSTEGAVENADFGHALRDNEAISDEEVDAATHKTAEQAGGHTETGDAQMDGEAVSDGQVDTATHEGDHNTTTKSTEEVAEVPVVEAPVVVADTVIKSMEENNLSSEDILTMTFKSLGDARAWRNPDPERYHYVSTSFEDRKKYGLNKKYIVKEKPVREKVGAHGNKIRN